MDDKTNVVKKEDCQMCEGTGMRWTGAYGGWGEDSYRLYEDCPHDNGGKW